MVLESDLPVSLDTY
jgi:hypothetical protein